MAKRTTIFAKLSPTQKAKIVKTLKDSGETVGFLGGCSEMNLAQSTFGKGDGVNDALALREADVGISVDTASELAKESVQRLSLHSASNVQSC